LIGVNTFENFTLKNAVFRVESVKERFVRINVGSISELRISNDRQNCQVLNHNFTLSVQKSCMENSLISAFAHVDEFCGFCLVLKHQDDTVKFFKRNCRSVQMKSLRVKC